MQVWGSYSEEHFSYIKVGLKSCNEETLIGYEKCADESEIAKKKTLRVYLPESSINYDKHDTEEALEWSLHSFYVMQLEPASHRK